MPERLGREEAAFLAWLLVAWAHVDERAKDDVTLLKGEPPYADRLALARKLERMRYE